MRGKILIGLLLLCTGSGVDARAARDTVSVYFPFNIGALTDTAIHLLDSAMFHNIINDRYPIQIIGYADEVGGEGYNLHLSMRRAESVKAFLVKSGFREDRITLITGRGEALAMRAAGPDGTPADRRVDIVRKGQPLRPPQETVTRFITTPAPPPGIDPAPPPKPSSIDLSRVEEGQIFVLEKIYFYAGRHIVRRESDPALEELYQALKANPSVRINIEGHVCCVPASSVDAMDDDTHRMELSVNRAKVIREYLIQRGIDASRLTYQGFGHRRPVISPETSEEDANKNRRVEIRVIK